MGLKEVPEHEAPLPAGKGRRTKTGNKRECSLNLILEQTILGKTLDTPPTSLSYNPFSSKRYCFLETF